MLGGRSNLAIVPSSIPESLITRDEDIVAEIAIDEEHHESRIGVPNSSLHCNICRHMSAECVVALTAPIFSKDLVLL